MFRLFVLTLLLPLPSYAATLVNNLTSASVELPIRTKLVYNCSTPEYAMRWCELRGACCEDIEPSTGEEYKEIDDGFTQEEVPEVSIYE